MENLDRESTETTVSLYTPITRSDGKETVRLITRNKVQHESIFGQIPALKLLDADGHLVLIPLDNVSGVTVLRIKR